MSQFKICILRFNGILNSTVTMLLCINATIEFCHNLVLCDSLYEDNYVWLESDLYYAPGKIVPRNVV